MLIYSQKLAAKLMLRGFILQGMRPNDKYPNKNVFIFKDSHQLKEVMIEFSNNK